MKVKQLIYFSWNENNAKKGYHVFAKSRGIDARDMKAIIEHLSYKPPKELVSGVVDKLAETSRLLGYPQKGTSGLHFTVQREIDRIFPTDCAFFTLPSGLCCCAKVTYCGVDYRLSVWGNHVIHAYIFSYDPKISPASIFFSEQFKDKISADELRVMETQKTIPDIEINENISSLETLAKLVKAKGVGKLSRMLDCIFAALRGDMDICINASEQDILFWMLVCQSLLPPEIITLMSFSTCRFSENDGSPFRIRHVISKLGSHYDYKLASTDTNHISVEMKRSVFSESAAKLQLSNLMAYLLLSSSEETEVLRRLIGRYVETHGVIDSDDICLIYRLARTDIYSGISDIELLGALNGVVLRSLGSETVDNIIEKYLDTEAKNKLSIKLYELLAVYHSQPEKIMSKLFYRMTEEVAQNRISAIDALDKLSDEPFGQRAVECIVKTLEEHRKFFEVYVSNSSAKSFLFRLLFSGFCDMNEPRAADLLIELIPIVLEDERKRKEIIPPSIIELISVVEYDEGVYRRVIYGYYDYCRYREKEFSGWCAIVALLFEEGRKLNSEAGISSFIMRELENGALLDYMKISDAESINVLALLSVIRRCGAISEKTHSELIYDKFKEFLYRSSNNEIISFVLSGLRKENALLVEALSAYMVNTSKNVIFDIYKATVGKAKSKDKEFLFALYDSDVRYIGETLVASSITSWKKFLAYLSNMYAQGYYDSCFTKAFDKSLREISDSEKWYFLSEVFKVCKVRFAEFQNPDFEKWLSALTQNIEDYMGKESGLVKVLSKAKEVSEMSKIELPVECKILLQTEETLESDGDILLSDAKAFVDSVSENLKDAYVNMYAARLIGLCVSDCDSETISASVWLALLSSDSESLGRLIKYISKLPSTTVRIVLGRIVDANIVSADYDKVETVFSSLLKHLKKNDYLALRKKALASSEGKIYTEIFEEAEKRFSIVARTRFAIKNDNNN